MTAPEGSYNPTPDNGKVPAPIEEQASSFWASCTLPEKVIVILLGLDIVTELLF